MFQRIYETVAAEMKHKRHVKIKCYCFSTVYSTWHALHNSDLFYNFLVMHNSYNVNCLG